MNNKNTNICFMLAGTLRGFLFNPHRPEGLRFTIGAPHPLDVAVKPINPGANDGGFYHGLECRVFGRRSVAPNTLVFVEHLLNGRFDHTNSSVKLPLIADGNVKIDETGRIAEGFFVPFDLYPRPIQDVCDEVFEELLGGLERFLKLLRWQQEIDAPHWLFAFEPALYWGVVEGSYYLVGQKHQGGATTRIPAGITWEDEDQRRFSALWSEPAAEEPLAHELLREAKVALNGSPRSGLLLAATALETGIKTHAAKLVADAGWLLAEMPSPPIHKMLRSYLPKLHTARGIDLARWEKLKPLFNDAQKLAEYRNDLTHAGKMPEKVLAALPELINSVSDLLYVLDVIDGHQWAKVCVSHKTRTLLGWPEPGRQRQYVKIEKSGGKRVRQL